MLVILIYLSVTQSTQVDNVRYSYEVAYGEDPDGIPDLKGILDPDGITDHDENLGGILDPDGIPNPDENRGGILDPDGS